MSLEINNYIEFEERSHTGLQDEHNHDSTGVFETKNRTIFSESL